MVCYKCGSETQVINSRAQRRANQVWRRRQCTLCDATFTTVEAIDYTKTFLVHKSDGQLQPFSRDHLMLSIYKSLAHRPTALADAGGLCATIIAKVTPKAIHGMVADRSIVDISLVALSRFDKLAAQHYQAMHKLT